MYEVKPRPAARPAGGALLLSKDQIAREVLGVSLRTVADVIKEPWFPRPIQLGPRLLRWRRDELEAALQSAPRQASQGGEPAQLRRGKIDALKARGVPA